jgi:hypothetical protein
MSIAIVIDLGPNVDAITISFQRENPAADPLRGFQDFVAMTGLF